MLKVAGPLQEAETTFVDLSYRAVEGEVESDSGSEDSKKERQDQAILQRLEEAVRPETKVSCPWLLFLFSFSPPCRCEC